MRKRGLHGLKKSVTQILVAVFCFGVIVHPAFAQPLSSKELINNAKKYDRKNVLYQGEAIGEIMKRGEFAWINLNDGENAIGVWMPVVLAKDISLLGNYKHEGDVVEVSGIFYMNCPEHGADLDIHAKEIKKVSGGRKLPEKINFCKARFALSLIFMLGLVWILSLLVKHWMRKQRR